MLPRRTLLALPFATPAQAACPPPIAETPLRLVEGYPVVPATLMGQPVSFIVDTGAQALLITPATAERLALPAAGLTRVFGTGGSQSARVVRLPGLRLGAAPMPEQSAPVLPLPIDLPTNPPLAGLLGATLLARFDLRLDLGAARLTLTLPADCPPQHCPPQPGTTLPLELSRAGEPFLPVGINGQTLLALLDTGSRATILGEPAARRLGLTRYISLDKAPGVDGAHLPISTSVPVRLALGAEPPRDTPISIAPLQLERGDMLLGMDVLAHRTILIRYAAGTATFGPPSRP